MREGTVDLIRERESCVKSELARHHPPWWWEMQEDSGEREAMAEEWEGKGDVVKHERRKEVTGQVNDS